MKKASVVSFLITLLLGAAVCIQGQEPVKDTAGNYLKTDQKYFIQPVKTERNNGGGLVPAPPPPTEELDPLRLCPLGIVQTLLPLPGLPVSFSSPVSFSLPFDDIYTHDSVNIEFKSDIWFCPEFSKFWRVDDSSSVTEEPPILVAGTPGKQNSGFKIENAGEGAGANTYKFTTFRGLVGTNSGIFGAPRLVLTNDKAKTLVVKFKKVDDATSATPSTFSG